jgi:hypothetical protein
VLLLNVVAPDRGRAKSLLLQLPLLVNRYLMSVPTLESIRYVPKDDVIRIPDHLPIRHRSLAEWTQFIANSPLLTTILDLPKPKSHTDLTQIRFEDTAKESEDESDDEQNQEEVNLEMLETVPKSIIESANQYEASMEEIHRQQIIEDVSQFVCFLCTFVLIVGS